MFPGCPGRIIDCPFFSSTSELPFFSPGQQTNFSFFFFFFLPWLAGQWPLYAVMPNRPTGLDGDFQPPLEFPFHFYFFSV
jgi:hypothetical protein